MVAHQVWEEVFQCWKHHPNFQSAMLCLERWVGYIALNAYSLTGSPRNKTLCSWARTEMVSCAVDPMEKHWLMLPWEPTAPKFEWPSLGLALQCPQQQGTNQHVQETTVACIVVKFHTTPRKEVFWLFITLFLRFSLRPKKHMWASMTSQCRAAQCMVIRLDGEKRTQNWYALLPKANLRNFQNLDVKVCILKIYCNKPIHGLDLRDNEFEL